MIILIQAVINQKITIIISQISMFICVSIGLYVLVFRYNDTPQDIGNIVLMFLISALLLATSGAVLITKELLNN